MSLHALAGIGRNGLLVLLGAALTSCSSITAHRDPAADLGRYHRFYVEHRLTDTHHVDEAIVEELKRLGREASSGPLTMKPDHVDAIVTYADRWEWDFKTYLIELTVDVRDARTDKPLTTARYYQPSMMTKAPSEMIHEMLARDFAPPAKH